MPAVVADSGLTALLAELLGAAPVAGAVLRLFVNNVVVDNTVTLASLAEASFTGYLSVPLAGWTAPALASHLATSTAAVATFTITAGTAMVYGWYVTDSTGGTLLFAQRDPFAPVAIAAGGQNQYQVTAQVQVKDNATP